MKEDIKLSCRYGYNHRLRNVEDNIYKLILDKSETVRVGGLPTDIEFIDPAGGPFLHKGSSIPGIEGKIESIYSKKDDGWYIKFI